MSSRDLQLTVVQKMFMLRKDIIPIDTALPFGRTHSKRVERTLSHVCEMIRCFTEAPLGLPEVPATERAVKYTMGYPFSGMFHLHSEEILYPSCRDFSMILEKGGKAYYYLRLKEN